MRSFTVVLLAVLLGVGVQTGAHADTETHALIADFNGYRIQRGVAPLTESAALDASAQASSVASQQQCGYQLPTGISGSYTAWQAYAYNDAASLWAEWQIDTTYLPYVANPDYNAVGIGRYYSAACGWGNLWTFIVAHANGIVTVTPAPTVKPSPKFGDVNCDGRVDALDALAILRAVALGHPLLPC